MTQQQMMKRIRELEQQVTWLSNEMESFKKKVTNDFYHFEHVTKKMVERKIEDYNYYKI